MKLLDRRRKAAAVAPDETIRTSKTIERISFAGPARWMTTSTEEMIHLGLCLILFFNERSQRYVIMAKMALRKTAMLEPRKTVGATRAIGGQGSATRSATSITPNAHSTIAVIPTRQNCAR